MEQMWGKMEQDITGGVLPTVRVIDLESLRTVTHIKHLDFAFNRLCRTES